MPIRPPNFHPPFNVVRVAYVHTHVTDLALAKAFWVDALGFVVTEEADDTLYLRGLEERNHHSVVLRKGPQPDVSAIGFKVFSEEDLDRASRFCAARGLSHQFVERPAQERTLLFTGSRWHTDRAVLQDAIGAFDAPAVRRLSWRPHPADRSRQLLFAGRAGVVRLLH